MCANKTKTVTHLACGGLGGREDAERGYRKSHVDKLRPKLTLVHEFWR